MSLNRYPTGPFLNVPTKPPVLIGAAGNPNALVTGPHSFSLGVTGEGGGAKEFVPHEQLELLTLWGKGSLHEGPLLRTGLPARPMFGSKARGPDKDQIRSRLGCEYRPLYLNMS